MGNRRSYRNHNFVGHWHGWRHLYGLLAERIVMTFIHYVAMFVTALGLFTYLCIPKGRFKVTATLVFIALAFGSFALAFETAGQPKPLSIEWREMTGERVIGFVPNEEAKIIYLWVMRDGIPVSYARPWSEGVQEMQDAWERKEDSGDEFYFVGDDEIAEVRREPQPPPKGMSND